MPRGRPRKKKIRDDILADIDESKPISEQEDVFESEKISESKKEEKYKENSIVKNNTKQKTEIARAKVTTSKYIAGKWWQLKRGKKINAPDIVIESLRNAGFVE